MGLIDFLEGAYQGGRLLFLLYDHDKQVKLRHKAMKGRGIKRLSNPSGVIVSESIKYAEKQALEHHEFQTPKRKSLAPSNGITSYYADISGGVFGAIGGLATAACESLIKASNARKKQELTRKEYDTWTGLY